MKIQKLAGIFTGEGFAAKDGRRVSRDDLGWIEGPIDIEWDEESGLIRSIQKNGPADASTVDGEGLIATAGFVDSHTHALFAGARAEEYFLRWRGATYVEIAEKGGGIHNTNRETLGAADPELGDEFRGQLSKMLRSGTTTVEVKSGYGGNAEGEIKLLRFLKRFLSSADGYRDLPSVHVTFLALHALPKGSDERAYVDSMIALLPEIRRDRLAEFADAFPEKGFFSLAESERFIRAAMEAGLKAKIHADEITDVGASAAFSQLGALSIDHLQQINDATLRSLSERRTVATLLPATSFYLGLPYAPARKLLDAGARVALATDFNPGTAPSSDMRFTQLLAATQYRMSPAEILCASTFGGAAAMGLEKNRGVLSKGRRADILLWRPPMGSSSRERLEQILLGSASIERVIRVS